MRCGGKRRARWVAFPIRRFNFPRHFRWLNFPPSFRRKPESRCAGSTPAFAKATGLCPNHLKRNATAGGAVCYDKAAFKERAMLVWRYWFAMALAIALTAGCRVDSGTPPAPAAQFTVPPPATATPAPTTTPTLTPTVTPTAAPPAAATPAPTATPAPSALPTLTPLAAVAPIPEPTPPPVPTPTFTPPPY